jgi:hypothetical protein
VGTPKNETAGPISVVAREINTLFSSRHPLFHLVPGAVAEWEVTQPNKMLQRRRQ